MSLTHYESFIETNTILGQVPSHWNIKRLAHIATIKGGGTPSRERLDFWNGDIPWVSPKDMKVERVVSAEECITELGLNNSTTTLQSPGHVLMVIRSGILQHSLPIAINDVPVAINQDLKSFHFDDRTCLPAFFLRWVQGYSSHLIFSWANEGATVESLNLKLLKNAMISLPPVDEQRSIAAFLDAETSKIDALVAEQRRLIELLKEKRQAVISHAVTKGLNPLVKMKPSGIDWLGDVPEHWRITNLRHLGCLVQTGPFGSQLHADEYITGGIPVINPTHIVNGAIVPSSDVTVSKSVLERLPNQILRRGDVVFSRRGELGRCALVGENEDGWLCGTGSMILRFSRIDINSRYFSFFISLDILRQYFESFSIGSVMDSLSSETLLSTPMLVPPIHEQDLIVETTIELLQKIQSLEAYAQNSIALLQERRTALISAAVTGKIDVRGFVPKEASA